MPLPKPYGYLTSIIGALAFIPHPFVFYHYQLPGLVLMEILALCTYAIDYFTSDTTEKNIKRLKANGYSTKHLATIWWINFFTVYLPGYFVMVYLVSDLSYRFDLILLLRIVLNLAATEVLFWSSHRALHRLFPNIHHLHHCCITPSWTSNMFFNPLDLAIEFSGPVFSIVFLSLVVFKDPFAMACTLSVQIAWYALDHDEYVKTAHWNHHYYISGNYTVYLNTQAFDKLDKVKDLVKRTDQAIQLKKADPCE